ncbi:unnamed protein product [Hydatigera taeniaeformis]|uniref:Uncharacterized protein n=1 Tax=Hydatigena taeniaeformis TaxID=6205 RepID=A0A3P7G4X3_HYDTA|nr:unnamed protein product [Hydatigera taeniaeformis]
MTVVVATPVSEGCMLLVTCCCTRRYGNPRSSSRRMMLDGRVERSMTSTQAVMRNPLLVDKLPKMHWNLCRLALDSCRRCNHREAAFDKVDFQADEEEVLKQ